MSEDVRCSTPPEGTRTDGDDSKVDHSSDIDRGVKAWGVVFAAFCMQMSVFGVINSCAIFENYFHQHQLQEKSPSEISWNFSLYLFLLYFLGLFVGPLFDRYGHCALSLTGSTVFVLSFVLLSFCAEYYQIILTFSVLGGLGGALLNTPSLGAISHFFIQKRGLATGVATSAGSLGGVIFPFVLRATLPSLGFAWSMRILALALLVLGIVSNAMLRTRIQKNTARRRILPDVKAFHDRKFQLCCAGIFLMEYGVLIPLTFIVSYADSQGQSSRQSYILPALLNAGSVLGRLIPGVLSDKLGRFNMLILTMLGCAVAVFAVWLPAGSSSAAVIVFALLIGFTSGGNVSLVPVCIGQICETAHFGRTLSTAMLAASVGTLTGIPLGGAVLGPGSPRWTMLILFSGISYAAAVMCYVVARVMAVGWCIRVIF